MTSRRELTQHIAPRCTMSSYKNFAIIGADATKKLRRPPVLKEEGHGDGP